VAGSPACGFDEGLKLQLKHHYVMNSTGPWTELNSCNDVSNRSMGWKLLDYNVDKGWALMYTIMKLDVS